MDRATAARHERRVVRCLLDRRRYPHPVSGPILHRETHISHVFLAGSYAYKLKKPVRFPFLDASTVARRRRWCRLEVRLNRRLTPQLYLGIVPVAQSLRGLRIGGRGRAVDWLVQMRRLPEREMLDRRLAAGRVTSRDIAAILDALIPFWSRGASGPSLARCGRPQAIERQLLGNLEECGLVSPSLLSERERLRLDGAIRQFISLREPLLRRRAERGRIIDGHGDLRCENICLTDPVTVFDCVEFEPAFRRGDVVGDLAFLAMDLEFRRRRDLAGRLVRGFQARTADPTLLDVLPLYQCHRSLVRGKVRALAWQQHPRAQRLRRLSRRHFRLAWQYARAMAPPRLVVVGGLIGTGKSALARGLAQRLGAVWLRTDEIRRREFARYRQLRQGFAEGLYAPRVSRLVYQRLMRDAARALREGRSVVCDGMFGRPAARHELRRIAQRRGASFHFFECAVPRLAALRRIARRLRRGGDPSEARPEWYDRLAAGFESADHWPARLRTRLTTAGSSSATLQKAMRALQRLWAPAIGGRPSANAGKERRAI